MARSAADAVFGVESRSSALAQSDRSCRTRFGTLAALYALLKDDADGGGKLRLSDFELLLGR